MSLLLDLVYLLAALAASPWIAYRLFARGDRRELSGRFGIGLTDQLAGSIWLHGSSAGEIALLVPFVRLLEQRRVENPLVISAYSSTGLAAARRSFPAHRVIVFPFDLSFVVRRVLGRLDPKLVVVVESEYWPNFLREAQQRGVPIAIVNGKISAKSSRFYGRTRLLPQLLRGVRVIAAQTTAHADRLRQLGVEPTRIHVTGNMKYDLATVPDQAGRARELRKRLGLADEEIVIIGGSVHEREDAALIETYKQLSAEFPRARLLLVPRYPRDVGRVEQLAAGSGFTTIRKTVIDRGASSTRGASSLIIVDTVGELRGLYAAADIAFVGGSLFYRGSNKGGHNLMEPAVVGLPVVFGPYHSSFEDTARALKDAGAGFEAKDQATLLEILRRLVDDEPARRASGRRAAEVIEAGRGATQRNFELLLPLIEVAAARLPGSDVSRTMPPTMSDSDSRP